MLYLVDGALSTAYFVNPISIAFDRQRRLYVGDIMFMCDEREIYVRLRYKFRKPLTLFMVSLAMGALYNTINVGAAYN